MKSSFFNFQVEVFAARHPCRPYRNYWTRLRSAAMLKQREELLQAEVVLQQHPARAKL